MKGKSITWRLGMSIFGLVCLTLFLGTENESCSSCGNLDEMLESEYGTIKIVNFLDLNHDYFMVHVGGNHKNHCADWFRHTWESKEENQVVQKKVKAGPYAYWWFGHSQDSSRERYETGTLVVNAGETLTLTIK